MKLTVGKRILMFFHWLLSLLICVLCAVYLIRKDFVMMLYDQAVALVGTANLQIIGIAVLALYVILALAQLMLIFRRVKKNDRGFITVDSSDSGKVRIAISAIEQMVRQSVTNIDGITDMKISIENKEDAIAIGVLSTIINGSHVPTITMNMQHAIRQFVEQNCGVAVRAVSVTINSVASQAEAGRKRGKHGKNELPPAPVAAPAPEPMPEPVNTYVQPEAPAEQPVSYTEPEMAYVLETPAEPVYEAPVQAVESAYDYAPEAPVTSDYTDSEEERPNDIVGSEE